MFLLIVIYFTDGVFSLSIQYFKPLKNETFLAIGPDFTN